MEQKKMSIFDFRPGDIITRLVPSEPMVVIGDETIIDRGYIGEELLFVGIANGCVNIERLHHRSTDIVKVLFNPTLIALPLDAYSSGWSYYIDPYVLLDEMYSREKEEHTADDASDSKLSRIMENQYESEENLKKSLEIAVRNQEFEKAEEIKKKIENLKNQKK